MAKTDFRDARKQIAKYKKAARKILPPIMREEITKSISRGVSPVKGAGRFLAYSQSYLAAIKSGVFRRVAKSKRPVNLKLTGALLESLKVKPSKNGLSISFDNKLADIHNRVGAGKSKTVRRMLPTNDGEEFSRSITSRLKEALKRVANNIFKG